MCYTRIWGILVVGFWLNTLAGQESFTAYWEPEAALNYRITDKYSHNASFGSRIYLYKENAIVLEVRQIDISHFSEFSLKDNQGLELGLLYRFREGLEEAVENEFRLMPQYHITHGPGAIRWGHRLRAEVRLFPSATVYRFRYRFTLDTPLEGQELNIGESYLIASTESLFSAAAHETPGYEQRLSLEIGWKIDASLKIQGGLEYRIDNYTRIPVHDLFALTGLVISL